MDKFFRPVLLAVLLTVLFTNPLFDVIPFWRIIVYFAGGFLAVYFFKREFKDQPYREVTLGEAFSLGALTGLGVAMVLLMVLFTDMNLQDLLIKSLNESMRMRSTSEFRGFESLGSLFYFIWAVMSFVICGTLSSFGALSAMAFTNKAKK